MGGRTIGKAWPFTVVHEVSTSHFYARKALREEDKCDPDLDADTKRSSSSDEGTTEETAG